MLSSLEAINIAYRFQQNGNIEKARQIYETILREVPQHPDALLGLGILARQESQLEAAKRLFETCLKTSPQPTKALFQLGYLHQISEQIEIAESYYRRLLELDSTYLPAQNNLGYILQNSGKLDEAIQIYKSILKIAPECGEAAINLANAFYSKGELPQDEYSHYANLNLQLGLEKQKSANFKDALSYFYQAAKLNPQLPLVHLHIGIILRDKFARLELAVTSFKKALQLQDKWADAYLELGRTYQLQKRFPEAIFAFKEWINLINPRYACLPEPVEPNGELIQYAPPSIQFEEVTVGTYGFPVIPRVTANRQNRPFWSVAIPALNRPEYFFECLASVLAQWQGDSEMEIIVLDNGSSPPLFDIVHSLGKGIIRYYRFPETVPLQENWNTMVALSRGQWVFLLQHDDYVIPGFFDRFQASLKTCPDSVGAAFTGYANIDAARQVVFTQQHNLADYRGIVRDWLLRIGVSCPLSPPSVVIRRAAYERLGGYKLDLPYTCDWEFYKRVATFYDWWYEPGILAHYRETANSITMAENMNGSSGAAHRRAIEISDTYLPQEHRKTISAKSRAFHFDWCLQRANIPLRVGNLEDACCLVREALKLDNSAGAIAKLKRWLEQPRMAPLKEKLNGQSLELSQIVAK